MKNLTSATVFAVVLAGTLAGCADRKEQAPAMQDGGMDAATVDIVAVAADLRRISTARVLLGHQSVGRNILAGVADLAADTGVNVRIVEIETVPPDSLPGLFHAAIGTNGDPAGKCQMFQRLLDRPERPAYDLAMMKFCYVDLGHGAPLDSTAVLARYSTMVEQLRATRPDIRIVHSTLPLRAASADWKSTIKRLIGRPPVEDVDNAFRNAFNDDLRVKFVSEPIFDLARVESTRPDGSRSVAEVGGRSVQVLAADFTNDGGHLNSAGQRRAAAEFLHTLATALEARRAEL